MKTTEVSAASADAALDLACCATRASLRSGPPEAESHQAASEKAAQSFWKDVCLACITVCRGVSPGDPPQLVSKTNLGHR